jgi:hypothetical protein
VREWIHRDWAGVKKTRATGRPPDLPR